MYHRYRILLLLIPLLALGACAGAPSRPALYPNEQLNRVGADVAQQDIDDCFAKAASHGVRQQKDGEIGAKAAKGAAIGGISTAVWDLIREGKLTDRTLAGAAAGAATGATAGAFESRKTDPVFQRFVDQCLTDKGYKVMGWQ